MSIFDRDTGSRHHGCHICKGKVEMTVLVQAAQMQSNRTARRVSKSRSYCMEHGEAVFRHMLATPQFNREL